jgi:hypothetical protein
MFSPAPSGVETRKIWWEPLETALSGDSDAWDPQIPRGDEYVELCAAIKALVKQESDPSALMAMKAQIENQVRSMAKNRDAGAPLRVQEVRNDFYSASGRPWNWF